MNTILKIGTVLAVAVAMLGIAHSAHAYLVPSQAIDANGIQLRNGDLISAAIEGDPDVYIIQFAPASNLVGYGTLPDAGSLGYKRLFLNPVIFAMYAHLGGWHNVHPVTAQIRDAFTTSGLFRNCETDSPRVWATEITGEDDGVLHHVDINGNDAVVQDPNFFRKVFCINTREENFYTKSIHAYTALSQLPHYERHQYGNQEQNRYGLTITSAEAYQEGNTWWIRIHGTLANSCAQLNGPSFSTDGTKFLVNLPSTQNGQVCTQALRMFTQTLRLGESFNPGLYQVYVNGQQLTSFIIETPTPTPTP